MSNAPEPRALLVTDVVDSTRLAESLGDVAMARLWAAHDRVARDLLSPHRGREIDKTDGFLLLFDHTADAVAYALAYHRAIGALDPPLAARAGLHVGSVVLTANHPADVARGAKPLEVDGLAKPTAARVMALAGAGQTLLTASAREELGATALRVASHGFWRLKGVTEPMELFEVGGTDAPFTPPADAPKAWRVVREGDLWLPARAIPHQLPRERDAFVGRDRDLQALARLVDDGAALVSVLGPAGTGKTRMVTRYAWTWLGDHPGGAWFVDLVDTRDAADVVAAVARALDVPPSDDLVTRVGRAIAGRGRCLVILDNFEQVVRHAGETVGRWLDLAQGARFVVTTREVLGLPGEFALALAPLDADDAEALFLTRAHQAGAAPIRDEADRRAVTDLVRLLDQLPLAIELAAARARLMPPKTLLERMSQRFRLLTTSGGRHTRQATLRAALDWSWDLLSPDEQAGLAQLSVFEGFTLEAAEAVLELRDAWPTDVVQGLLDKSLVRRLPDDRLALLVSVQEYAAERLGDQRAAAELRHGAYYAAWGSGEHDWPDSAAEFAARDARSPDVGNLLAACRRAVSRGDAEVALGTLAAAVPLPHTEGDGRVLPLTRQLIASRDALNPIDRLRATRIAARVHRHTAQRDVLELYEDGLQQARALGRPRDQAALLNGWAATQLSHGNLAAGRAGFQEAVDLCRADGYLSGESLSLGHLGIAMMASGDLATGIDRMRTAMGLARRVGDPQLQQAIGANLSGALIQSGEWSEGEALALETLAPSGQTGLFTATVTSRINLAILCYHQGRLAEAHAAAAAALPVARASGDPRDVANLSVTLCAILAALGRFDEGRAAGREAVTLFTQLGMPHNLGAACCELAELELLAGDTDRAEAVLTEGLALVRRHDDREGLGVGLCVLVAVALARGDRSAAQQAFAEATEIVSRSHLGPRSQLVGALARARAALDREVPPTPGPAGR